MKAWAPLTLSLALPYCDLDSTLPPSSSGTTTTAPPGSGSSSHSPTCDAKGTVDPHPDLSTRCTGDTVAFNGSTTYTSLQDAVDAASNGDTLYLCPRTHKELVEISSLNLTLASASGDPTDTILDGEGKHRLIVMSKVDLTLYNLTVESGWGSQGGAIEATSSILDLQCVTFADNVATISGGAIDFDMGGLSATYSTFTDNAATEQGGAIRFGGALDSSLTLESTVFEGNTSEEVGGALHLGDKAVLDSVYITDCRFAENIAQDDGGAIALDTQQAMDVQIFSTEFYANVADGVGGAIVADGSADEYDIWLDDVLFEANVAPSGSAVEITDDPQFADLDFYQSSVLANESDSGAAVRTSNRSVLWSEDSDWGVRNDPMDNVGDDVDCRCGDYDTLQSAESFLCTLDGAWRTGS